MRKRLSSRLGLTDQQSEPVAPLARGEGREQTLSPLPVLDSFLVLRRISKQYGGVTALDEVDLEIRRGEVHCLVGENGSGKSTLVKIITGVVRPEARGEIEIEGHRWQSFNPLAALNSGIHVVHQDLSLFPNLSVAENIAIHQHVQKGFGFVNRREMNLLAQAMLHKLGISLSPDALVGALKVAEQQFVAIARALAGEVKLIILDEPTASLTEDEAMRLFSIINGLKEQGISTLFISHRLSEILEIGQRITILRDGRKVGTFSREELNKQKLVSRMTGKELGYSPHRVSPVDLALLLEVKGLSKKGQYEDIGFMLRKGEILGIIGPRGAGRTELALTLFGMNPPDVGEIHIEGKLTKIKSNRHAVRLRIGYVPENRLVQGIVLDQSVEHNLIVTILDRLTGRLGTIDNRRKRNFAEKAVEAFNIKVPAVNVPAKTLSGGNQQKVVLAKWILTKVKLLILDEPTIGVDVAARESIYKLISALAKEGVGVILISDEASEVLQNCERFLMMKRGRVIGEYHSDEIAEEDLEQMLRGENIAV